MDNERIRALETYLGCPCRYFPAADNAGAVLAAYREARARGAREGFTPILLVDDAQGNLLENILDTASTEEAAAYRKKLLERTLPDGAAWFQEQLAEQKEMWAEDGVSWDEAELMGEITDSEAATAFCGYENFGGKGILPVLLAEIPTANPWEVFAWVPFGGWNECPDPEGQMTAAKYWYEKYGAVPALISADVLEYDLPAPVPEADALSLAWEQYAFCSDIVDQGVETVGALAGTLKKSTVWFFWWD